MTPPVTCRPTPPQAKVLATISGAFEGGLWEEPRDRVRSPPASWQDTGSTGGLRSLARRFRVLPRAPLHTHPDQRVSCSAGPSPSRISCGDPEWPRPGAADRALRRLARSHSASGSAVVTSPAPLTPGLTVQLEVQGLDVPSSRGGGVVRQASSTTCAHAACRPGEIPVPFTPPSATVRGGGLRRAESIPRKGLRCKRSISRGLAVVADSFCSCSPPWLRCSGSCSGRRR